MLKEFKAFAMRGNVIDLAVGVVIGGAFGAIVKSVVADIFMPIIGVLTGGLDFSGLSYTFGEAVIAYGSFLQATFVFLITAFALFLLVKGINRMKKKEEEKPAEPAAPPADIVLLTEIRDLLKK
ncbi:MAG: large-conductance mechanosensitive channel protein MscL [Cyclobacteriaceae bacterium]|nr:large-conductance mechanosensitive channel protein MscL [Cyclobacteriaceae bacterium]